MTLPILGCGLASATTHGYCSAAMSSSKSLIPLRFSLVGPGRVGSSLAHWLVGQGAEIVAIAGRDAERTVQQAQHFGASPVSVEQLQTGGQDLLLLAVSDPALHSVVTSLAAHPQAEVVLHTSGALDASVLGPLRATGSSTGSLHPLMAFPGVLTDVRHALGSVFALDGASEAQALASRLAESWGGIPVQVPAEARPIYHLAASLAAGGVVTLLAAASEMADQQGLPQDIMRGYLALARGAIEQAACSSDIPSAITGPLVRGDLETFQRQVAILQERDPDLAQAVIGLGRLTLRFRPAEGELRERSEAPLEPEGR